MKYATEEQMSRKFRDAVLGNLPKSKIVGAEVKGSMGIPDYVVLENKDDQQILISYELKLWNWRRALRQAFRYKTFANQSYVVLDEATCSVALDNLVMFIQYNVGLASFDSNGCMTVHYQPALNSAFSDYSHSRVVEELCSQRQLSAANP